MYAKFSITVTALAATVSAAPSTLVARFGDSYTFYKGDGSTAQGWPAQTAWGTFDQLWSANVPLMQKSCGWNGWGADNSAAEISNIKSSIAQVAGESGVDQRFILAVVMQESKGCVRAPTTDNGVRNPGLMQSHNGAGTCVGKNPCPAADITQMIRDGTSGTAAGDGLKQVLAKAQSATGDGGVRKYYAAARLYNSGSATYGNLNDGRGSTNCYSTDVANRLTGWTLAPSKCNA
ncbi:muramidase, putative [Cordyceps militaris CM01]|uniref:Muramidase, putative n=1 Tax=Cordyceps militaris (strain CM01) TaxID=983644 RepID=G3JSW5_CORMM|nr:muramidase, putative [Cordyceps militaris CM01]EGX88961.1 muramidase, putative [Cordyceps militaris CM01]